MQGVLCNDEIHKLFTRQYTAIPIFHSRKTSICHVFSKLIVEDHRGWGFDIAASLTDAPHGNVTKPDGVNVVPALLDTLLVLSVTLARSQGRRNRGV